MITIFDGETANEVWLKAAKFIQDNESDVRVQSSRAGMTRELLHAGFSIKDPRQRWITARQLAFNPVFAIVEVVWIMTGRNDASFLKYWNKHLPKFVGNADNLHGAYGFRLRKHFGLDQIERAYQALRGTPNSRQVVLQIWDCNADLPDEEGRPADADIPCNIMSALKLRDNKLEWLQTMRSNDLFRGTPYNFIQFTTIQEVLAGWLGVEIGSYNHISDSLHLYESDYQSGRLETNIEAKINPESLALPKEESERVFGILESSFERMQSPNLQVDDLISLTNDSDLPTPYRNLVRVVAAEAARKRRWVDTMEALAATCTNPVLSQAWERWVARLS